MATTERHGLFYVRNFSCLVDGTTFKAFRMYPSHRRNCERLDDYFDVSYYEPGKEGAFSNRLYMEIQVCPKCGFASNDETHFKCEQSKSEPLELAPATLDHLKKQAPARLELLKQATGVHECPRTPADVQLIYKMAILTSTALFNVDQRRFAGETVRLANYCLKLARISEEIDQPERVDAWRRAAMKYLEQSFEADVKGVTRYRGLYQLAALAIYYGNDTPAARAFENLRKTVGGDLDKDLKRYIGRIKLIWENRDMHRKDAPKPPPPSEEPEPAEEKPEEPKQKKK